MVDIEKMMLSLKDWDLLVRIKVILVNFVDIKVRWNFVVVGNMCILGWDVVGEIVEVGFGV